MKKIERTEKLQMLCTELWNDYRNEKWDYDTLDLHPYTEKYETAHFPKSLIAPVLLKRTEPTLVDADQLRKEINKYVGLHRRPDPETVMENLMEEQTAIALLKRRGYRVMKKTYVMV